MTVEKDLADAVQYVAGGKIDELPLNALFHFMITTRGMAEIAETEMRRRGAYPFPAWRNAAVIRR